MANIAQMVNVIQAVILTDKDKMVLTPTYHVFEMYKVHQDAELIELNVDVEERKENGHTYPHLSASASKAKDGTVNISLCNLDKAESAELTIDLHELGAIDFNVKGKILTSSKMNARNTFEEPDNVTPIEFTGFIKDGQTLKVKLPSKSVVLLSTN